MIIPTEKIVRKCYKQGVNGMQSSSYIISTFIIYLIHENVEDIVYTCTSNLIDECV